MLLSPARSAISRAAQQIKAVLRPSVPFYSMRTRAGCATSFYIHRTVTLVDYQDEMAYGLQQEPALWVPTLAEFNARWRADPYALAVAGA